MRKIKIEKKNAKTIIPPSIENSGLGMSVKDV